MRRVIILGIGSDIGRELSTRLQEQGWYVFGARHIDPLPLREWDLIVCCYGVLDPVGPFWETGAVQWDAAVQANVLHPLRDIRRLYPLRRPGASVCFFSGAGTGGAAPSYSAYAASKVMLIKMTELLDAESEDCKFFILGPGVVRTKIHEQTLRAGPERAANYERVSKFMESGGKGTSHDDIYACLMACVAAPKAAVGGRNICVHLDDWSRLSELADDSSMFKLRRAGDASLRRVRYERPLEIAAVKPT